MVSKLVLPRGTLIQIPNHQVPNPPNLPNLLLAEQWCLDKKIPTTFDSKEKKSKWTKIIMLPTQTVALLTGEILQICQTFLVFHSSQNA